MLLLAEKPGSKNAGILRQLTHPLPTAATKLPSASCSPQVQLEQQAKEAAERENSSLLKSLEAERRRVEATRAEAAASAEALEAERAAKWAADAEAKALQEDLAAATESLRRER